MIHIIFLTTIFLLQYQICAADNVWNEVVSFKGQLEPSDYTVKSEESRFYTLEILSNNRFQFKIIGEDQRPQLLLQGLSIPKQQNMSLHSYGYLLQGEGLTPMKGSISYETGWGVTWTYNIEINQMRISLSRSQVRYKFLFIFLVIVFGVSSLLIFSISERYQNKIIYNLKIRTHPLVIMMIILKAFWVGGCFIIAGYVSFFQLPIWGLLFFYGSYLISLSPSIIHLLYLFSAAQRNVVQTQFYQSKSKEIRLAIVLGSLFIFLLLFVISLAVAKGILFYYLISITNIFIYIYSWKSKKFAYGPLIIYDLLLTLTLSAFSLFYPIQYFTPVSFKQMILFWNFYIFLLIFGLIFMKKLIRSEIVEQIQLREFSLQTSNSQIDRQTKQTHQPQSAQIIEQ